MTTLKERQRAAARARLAREMAERQAKAHERRRRTIMAGGAGVAVLVVIGLVALIISLTGGSGKKPSATATQAAPVTCVWAPNPDPSASPAQPKNPNLKNTGTPPTTTAPQTGTRDMVLDTTQGKITITLDVAKAPCAAQSFAYLASKKFFDKTSCGRMTNANIFILQCGDPGTSGSGGPSYTFGHENLPTDQRPDYPAGVVAMAIPSTVDSSGQQTPASDSNGSQFFIVYKDTPIDPSSGDSNLPPDYTVVGTVSAGMDVVQKIAAGGLVPTDKKGNPNDGKPKLPVVINTLTVGAPKP